MIHFSKSDNDRSIPNLVDGLKTSLRKILFTVFRRNIRKELKVAQLSGSVSELSGYHHGEASLHGGIVGMAQNFVGSNNINLLLPNGQFGTRLEGGKDAASERYIFTEPNPLTRLIFPESDDMVLNYLDDDGMSVEPQFYAPIVPMLCINGCKGIGTGFSTDISPCNPLEVIDYLTHSLRGQSTEHFSLNPYYNGFTGTITPIGTSKYLIRGKYTIISDKRVHVTELPIGTWTATFKKHLEDIVIGSADKKAKTSTLIRDYTDCSTDSVVDFTVDFAPGVLSDLLSKEGDYGCNGLEKLLKLYTTITTTNMHAFDQDEKLRHFKSHREIIDAYIPVRCKVYEERKAFRIGELTQTVLVLSNKARFIQGLLKSPPEIELRGQRKAEVTATLQKQV